MDDSWLCGFLESRGNFGVGTTNRGGSIKSRNVESETKIVNIFLGFTLVERYELDFMKQMVLLFGGEIKYKKDIPTYILSDFEGFEKLLAYLKKFPFLWKSRIVKK